LRQALQLLPDSRRAASTMLGAITTSWTPTLAKPVPGEAFV